MGATFSKYCHSKAPLWASVVDAINLRHPEYQQAIPPGIMEICEFWPADEVGDDYREPLQTDIPILAVHTALSPSSDPLAVSNWARTATNFTQVVFDSADAWVFDWGPACLGDLRRQFLQDPQTPLPANEIAACEAQSPPIQFLTP